jgi:hypothetical protein
MRLIDSRYMRVRLEVALKIGRSIASKNFLQTRFRKLLDRAAEKFKMSRVGSRIARKSFKNQMEPINLFNNEAFNSFHGHNSKHFWHPKQ